jgi:acetyltransferase EpsM
LIIGFGDCSARIRLAQVAKRHGFQLARAIHPSAVIAGDVVIGEGSVIAAGAVVNPGSLIGENVVINTCASIDHECRVATGAHICPGVRLAGRVSIGCAAHVGIGSIVKEGVRIGASSIIGAGSVVLRDIPDNVVAYGNPARVIRTINAKNSD